MKKRIILICFVWPLISSCINVQLLVSTFVSVGISQLIAYSNILLIIIGIVLITPDKGKLSKTGRIWFFFYLLYYCFSLLASGISGFENPEYTILASAVPVIYFTGFYFFLSRKDYFSLFTKVITIGYVLSSFLTILLFKLNFDFDHGGFYLNQLNRAGGVYADANNAALGSILAYVLFNNYFRPKTFLQKIFKIFILCVIFYSLLLTLSTTGLFTFVIVFISINYKYFTGLKVIFFGVVVSLFYLSLFNIEQYYDYFNLSDMQIMKVNNIKNVLTFETDKINSSGREELAQNLLEYIYQNPIIGNGLGFSNFVRGHNTYLGVWGDAGIFTFLFFIVTLIIYFVKSFKLNINSRFFCISILLTLCVFMLTLQTVINQAYIIVLFPLISYIFDKNPEQEPLET